MLAEETHTLFEQVFDLIEEDPEGIFKTTKIAEHPEANFQIVALKRLQGNSWYQLEVEFKIARKTLIVFYWNSLQKFKPHLKECLRSHSIYEVFHRERPD